MCICTRHLENLSDIIFSLSSVPLGSSETLESAKAAETSHAAEGFHVAAAEGAVDEGMFHTNRKKARREGMQEALEFMRRLHQSQRVLQRCRQSEEVDGKNVSSSL
jgi:hypothetical protein